MNCNSADEMDILVCDLRKVAQEGGALATQARDRWFESILSDFCQYGVMVTQ